ncbi:DNA modification methylase [Cenarchaeum symbiosum A]|uniref:Type II methyltransferase n=1 Tax=Cenarchaeum symbiosum (strain A) TaxID=414004 RepID=A0RV12_CENSY|nr:DNA modification methylase [Cenarchaeum symbiosum A]
MVPAANRQSVRGSLAPFLNTVRCGDSAKMLKDVPSGSVDLVITSPPYYQQRDYGGGRTGNEGHVEAYIDSIMQVFEQCVRVTKETGSIVFNMGDKYSQGSLMLVPYRFAIRATGSGAVRLVNNTTWVKTNPTPRQFKRRLVSGTEPFFHFAKSDSYCYNIDDFQRPETGVKKPPENTRVGEGYKKLIESSELEPVQKRRAQKALQEAIEETKSGAIAGFRMKIRGIHSPAFGGQAGGRQIQLRDNGFTIIRMRGNPIKRDVIHHQVESIRWNAHPAIYPVGIIAEFIRLLTPKGAVVLDPYMGSGTTGVAARSLGRSFMGIELNAGYCRAANKRISAAG